MRILRCLLAAGVLLAATGAGVAQETPPVERYRLENGLEVLLAPDHKVPKAGLALIYRVGGMNEPAGRSGFAHLFEHLMFSGTSAYPDIDETAELLGVSQNASTEDDRTVFVSEGLASALPVLLSIEADRMANLGGAVDQREFEVERDVVKNEMRETVLDSAGQAGVEALRTALFPKPHPYAEAVIGSIADLDAAQLGDVRAFFDTYYVPNNAILSVAGDFEVEAVKAMIEETFGLVARGGDIALPEAEVPAPVEAHIDSVGRVPSPMVVLATAGPASTTRESVALGLAADVLGNYEYGVLRQTLVGSGLATSATAAWDGGRLGGRFIISLMAAPGVSAEQLESAARQVVTQFAATPLAAADVERARSNALIGRRLATEAMLDRARALATRYDLYGEDSPGLGDDPVLLGVTAAEVEAAFRKYVVPETLSVLVVSPGVPQGLPQVLEASSGVAAPLTTPPRPPVAVPMLAAGTPGRSALPERQTADLSNGIRIVHYQVKGTPRMLVAVSVTGGTGNDIPGKEGLVAMTANLMARGAGERDFQAFSMAAKDIGADVSAAYDRQITAMVLQAESGRFAESVGLLADAVERPRFDEAAWTSLKAEVVQGVAYQMADPGTMGYLDLEAVLFARTEGQPGLEPSVASLSAVTLEDVRAMYARLFTPGAVTIYTVGDLGLEEVEAALAKAFGDWRGEGEGLAGVPHPPAVFPAERVVHVVPAAGTTQAIIYLARPAPAFEDAGLVEAVAVADLLGGAFGSRLNAVLREAKGYSYGVSASLSPNIPSGGMLLVSAPVAADKAGPALGDILAGFAGLRTVPVTPKELQRTVATVATGTAGTVETSLALFNLVVGSAGRGLTAEQMTARYDEITALQLPAVQKQAEALAGLEQAVVVVVGDPALLVPQLEAIGIEAAVVGGAP